MRFSTTDGGRADPALYSIAVGRILCIHEALLAAICTSQARCSVHSGMKAFGTDVPQASTPWLLRQDREFNPGAPFALNGGEA